MECIQALGVKTEKSQDIRVLDFLVLGPFMIWFGAKAKGMPEIAKAGMVLSGFFTILYNYQNWQAEMTNAKIS